MGTLRGVSWKTLLVLGLCVIYVMSFLVTSPFHGLVLLVGKKKDQNDSYSKSIRSLLSTTVEKEKDIYHQAIPPTLFYHIGPPKTGTTSLQCTLAMYRQILSTDKILFIGKTPPKFCPEHEDSLISAPFACLFDYNCLVKVSKYYKEHSELHPKYFPSSAKEMVMDYYQRNFSIILSEETHSLNTNKWEEDPDCIVCFLPRLIIDNLFDIYPTKKIMIGYRYYWDYWLSSMLEMNRIAPGKARLKSWDGRELDSVLERLQDEVQHPTTYISPRTSSLLQFLGKRYEMIVLNLHQDDYIEQLLCHILQARKTCRQYNRDKIKPSVHTIDVLHHLNPSSALSDYDRLVMHAAHKMGWIDTDKFSRREVYEMTIHQTDLRVEYQCPTSDQLEQMLIKSIRDEYHIFQTSRADHQTMFQESAHKFCVLDVNTTLTKSKTWEVFFKRNFGNITE